jgi:tetratricopeptide (TPR) repeat protein
MSERVSHLESDTQRVLNACAVLGRFASAERVAAVLGVPTTALAKAVEQLGGLGLVGIARECGPLGLHDLWQEHLIASMAASVKSFLHLRAGQVLEAEATHVQSSALAIAAARHLTLGGAPEAALRLLEGTVARLLRVGLYEDAVECSESALAVAVDDRTRFIFAQLRLEALQYLGRWQAILESIGEVQALARACGQSQGRHSRLELLAVESDMLHERQLDGTLASLVECVNSASAGVHHRADAARLAARAASNAFRAGDLASLLEVVDRLDQSDEHVRAQALAVRMIYHADLGDIDVARRSAAELVEVERSQRSLAGLCHALRNQTVPLRIMGEFDAAITAALEAYHLATTHHMPAEIAMCADIVGCIMFERGNLAEASKWLAEAEPHLTRIGGGHSRESVVHVKAMIALEESDLDTAATLISELDWERHGTLNRMALVELAVSTRLAVLRGNRELAAKLGERLQVVLSQISQFRRLGYAAASLGICVEFLASEAVARQAVLEFRRPTDTRAVAWRELANRWT